MRPFRPVILAGAVASVLALTTSAFAAEPEPAKSGETASPDKAKPTVTIEYGLRPSVDAGPGFVMGLSTGLTAFGGSIGKGLPLHGLLWSTDLRLGGYVTRNVGILGGAQVGVGHLGEGCAGECSAYQLQFPVVVQVALVDRWVGPYAEAGAAFLSKFGGNTSSTAKHRGSFQERIEGTSNVDLKLGVGYRIAARATDANGKTRHLHSLDIRLGLDAGRFDRAIYDATRVGRVEADIDPSKAALHYAVNLAVGAYF